MRATTVAAIATAVCAAAVWRPVLAQQQAAQQPGQTVTVVGCLQRPQSAGSVAGTPTGAPASPNQADYRANSSVPDPGFILAGATARAGAEKGDAAKATPTGTSGAAGGGSATADRPMTYALVGDDSTLAPHVGHTVEVSGVVAPPAEAKAPSNTPDPAPSPGRATDRVGTAFQTGVRQLRVTTIRMTANSCAQRP